MDDPRLATVRRESLPGNVDTPAADAWKLLAAGMDGSSGIRILATTEHAYTADGDAHECHHPSPLIQGGNFSSRTGADGAKYKDEVYAPVKGVELPQIPSSSPSVRHELTPPATGSKDVITAGDREERQAYIEESTDRALGSTDVHATAKHTGSLSRLETALSMSEEGRYWQLKWATEKILAQPERAALLYKQMQKQKNDTL